MRVTKDKLRSRVGTLNMMLERPMALYTPGYTKSNTGHLSLDINSTGFRLVEQLDTGGERDWSSRLSGKEMDIFIDGIVRGIALRNEHIGASLVKHKLEQAGLTSGALLYSDDSVIKLTAQAETV